jgi:hypothetical protein
MSGKKYDQFIMFLLAQSTVETEAASQPHFAAWNCTQVSETTFARIATRRD